MNILVKLKLNILKAYCIVIWFKLLNDKVRFEPQHGISNNVVCATSKASDQSVHKHSLIRALASRLMSVKLLTEYHLEFLRLKGDCTG